MLAAGDSPLLQRGQLSPTVSSSSGKAVGALWRLVLEQPSHSSGLHPRDLTPSPKVPTLQDPTGN